MDEDKKASEKGVIESKACLYVVRECFCAFTKIESERGNCALLKRVYV